MKPRFPRLSFAKLPGDFFGILLIIFAIIFVWRGLWNLMDLYLFPNHPLLSNILSIFLGLFILYLPDEDIKELI